MSLPVPFATTEQPIFLMDGSAYIYRSFYANSSLRRADGFPTGALLTMSRLLFKILRQETPRYFVFVKDGHGENFRHRLYADYKANRDSTPADLMLQLEPIQRMVEALGIPYIETVDCEADDCIASLAQRFASKQPIVILSGDKDLRQCLTERVVLWDIGSKEEKFLTAQAFREEIGVDPAAWADMQALIGDSVDNIPGVPGIGVKSAIQLFASYPSLESIRDHFNLLSPKLQKLLKDHLEKMFLWRQLTRLSVEEYPHILLKDLSVQAVNFSAAIAIADEFQMPSIKRELIHWAKEYYAPSLGSEDLFASEQAQTSPKQELSQSSAQTQASLQVSKEACEQEQKSVQEDAEQTKESVVSQTSAASVREQDSLAQTEKDAPKTSAQLRSKQEQSIIRGKRVLAAPSSLLTLLASEQKEEKVLASFTNRSELPTCIGKKVAFLGGTKAFMQPTLAVQGEEEELVEFYWTGAALDLEHWLADAQLLVVPDAKAILENAGLGAREVQKRSQEGEGTLFDLGLAAYLFSPEEEEYTWERLQMLASSCPGADQLGPGGKALALEKLYQARLEREGLDFLYKSVEIPLVTVLADMEAAGVRIDMDAFDLFLDEVQKELSELTTNVHEAAGQVFNIRSSQQLAEILYTKLGLPSGGKTKQGKASTSQEALERLAGKHAVVDIILRYRKLEKIRSTYLKPLPRLTDAHGRIHTTFNQKATATGRLSSSNPNLQNIPIRGPLGKRMRACFVADAGNALVSCDYSQIELRVLAHMSNDPELIHAFEQGEDIHAKTAALIYECAPEQVSADQRRNAKTINFGLIYGMGPKKLGQELGISSVEAKKFIERYFAKLSHLKGFYEQIDAGAHRDGFVTTLTGRRRHLVGIHSEKAQYQAIAKRQAVNTVIQGTAADIIKLAMLAVWNDALLKEWQARLVLQIHDELVLEVPEQYAQQTGERVASLMQSVQPQGIVFKVPLVVDWGQAKDWGDAH